MATVVALIAIAVIVACFGRKQIKTRRQDKKWMEMKEDLMMGRLPSTG